MRGSVTNIADRIGGFEVTPVTSNTDSVTITAIQTPATHPRQDSVPDMTYGRRSSDVGDEIDYTYL